MKKFFLLSLTLALVGMWTIAGADNNPSNVLKSSPDVIQARELAPPEKAPYTGPINVPDQNVILQGGDMCEDATHIPAIPYLDNGTTAGYSDDYDEICPYPNSTSPDVVYAYTPDVDISVNISLCQGQTDYDTKLYVYEDVCQEPNDGQDPYACNDDYCDVPVSYVSYLECVPMFVGHTYYVVIDGYDGDAGDYTLEITECVSPSGACCVGIDCVATNTEAECGNMGGTWYEGQTCPEFQCPSESVMIHFVTPDFLIAIDGNMSFTTIEWSDTHLITAFSGGLLFYEINPVSWKEILLKILKVILDALPEEAFYNGGPPVFQQLAGGYFTGDCDITGPCGQFSATFESTPDMFSGIFDFDIPDSVEGNTAYCSASGITMETEPGVAQETCEFREWIEPDLACTSQVEMTTYFDPAIELLGPQTITTSYSANLTSDTSSVFEGVATIRLWDYSSGACCDDGTGICEDYILDTDCDGRFAAYTMCADLDPPCGEGPWELTTASRPFAIDTSSGMQRCLGVFESEAGEALIGMYVINNLGVAQTNVQITMSAPEGSGIVMTSPMAIIADLPPAVSTLVLFAADFTGVVPDKYDMELVLQSDQTVPTYKAERIFTSTTTINPSNPDFGGRPTFTSQIPEGAVTVDIETFQDGPNWRSRWAPTRETQMLEYAIPFEGQFGSLPYSDWFWKAAGLVGKALASVASTYYIVEGIVEGDCAKTAAGVGTRILVMAECLTWSDDADPFIRGQENTFPGAGELTFKEVVAMDVTYLDEPINGDDFRALTTWTYTRFTVDDNQVERTYEYSIVDEMVTNSHWGGMHTLETDRSEYLPGDTVVFNATIEANDGELLITDEAYCNVIVQSSPEIGYPVMLRDDGQGVDEVAGDGVYSGSMLIPETSSPGEWAMMLFAQENLFGFNEYGGLVLNTFPTGDPICNTFQHGNFIVTASDCVYIAGDVNCNGTPAELPDVITMVSMYRGTVEHCYECDCPPHGEFFAPHADPNGNCISDELSDVVAIIGIYRGILEPAGCEDCPGQGLLAPGQDGTPVVPPLKSKVKINKGNMED